MGIKRHVCPGCNIEKKTSNRLTLFNKYSIPRSSSNMAFLTVRLSSLLLTPILSLNLSSLQLPSIHLTSLQLTSILLCILLSSLQLTSIRSLYSSFLLATPSILSIITPPGSFLHSQLPRVLSPPLITQSPFSAPNTVLSPPLNTPGPFSIPKYPGSFLHP